MKKMPVSAAVLLSLTSLAQEDSTALTTTNPLTISGYIEGYYCYDFNKPENNSRPAFLYNFNRHNEFPSTLVIRCQPFSAKAVKFHLPLLDT